MSEDNEVKTETNENNPVKTEFVVEIKISDKNLSYRSDFSEAETIFWLESVKGLIIKNTFDKAGISQN
jgi:hypothetical protein